MKGMYFIVEPEALERLIEGRNGHANMRDLTRAAKNLPGGNYRVVKAMVGVLSVVAVVVKTTVLIHGQSVAPSDPVEATDPVSSRPEVFECLPQEG